MYLLHRAISLTTIHAQNPLPLLPTKTQISHTILTFLKNAWRIVSHYLLLSLRWTGHRISRLAVFLWRLLKMPEISRWIGRTILWILKFCRIAVVGIVVFSVLGGLGYWGGPKLLEMYRKREMRIRAERRETDERIRQEAYLSELRARQDAQGRVREEARKQHVAEATALREARARQVREEQAFKEKLKRDEEAKVMKTRAGYTRWETLYLRIFQDRPAMTIFPFPPLARCTDTTCPEFLKQAPVPACQHNVKQFFNGSGKVSLEFLKTQRYLWHEDRFASCEKGRRREFGRLANSLFVVLDPWYEGLKMKQTKEPGGG